MITKEHGIKAMMAGLYVAYFGIFIAEQAVKVISTSHPFLKMGKARLLYEIDIARTRLKTGCWTGREAGRSTEDIVVVTESYATSGGERDGEHQ